MRVQLLITVLAVICATSISCRRKSQADNTSSPELRGPYLGQPAPSTTPDLFAPGLVSRGYHELGIAISTSGDECFYVTANNKYPHYVIIHLKSVGGVWSSPEVASFSGFYSDYRPCFSPDGNSLFFSSVRPLPGGTAENTSHDIWRVEKKGEHWSDPIHLGFPLNSGNPEINPAVASSGMIYFQSMSEDGQNFDIYFSAYDNGSYGQPQKLPGDINTEYNEGGPFVAPDESYLVFHSNRPGGVGRSDLYISFREEDGTWSRCVNLGAPVNSPESETIPFVSADGKFLFYTSFITWEPEAYKGKTYQELINLYQSPKNGTGTLYWVDADFVWQLREKARE
ncbi:MAG: PD40 domain-containing protein [Candidatus Zixiibacteriota bacterium]|nr:MAG: PD40 domain-containing protein [candidate division Zixibacteria bacterium]